MTCFVCGIVRLSKLCLALKVKLTFTDFVTWRLNKETILVDCS